jgi:hypothetical protein
MSDYRMGMEAGARQRLERNVGSVVRRLHDLADRIARESINGIERAVEGKATYAQVAAMVAHEVTWGVANTNLSNVIDAADSADQMRADKKQAELEAQRLEAQRLEAQRLEAQRLEAQRDDTPVMNQTGAINALAAMRRAAQGWAEGTADNDRAMERRDVQPTDRQPFVLADILNMIDDAAREVGVAPVYGEK